MSETRRCPRCNGPIRLINDTGPSAFCSGWSWWECCDARGCGWREFDGWDTPAPAVTTVTVDPNDFNRILGEYERLIHEYLGLHTRDLIIGMVRLDSSNLEVEIRYRQGHKEFKAVPTREILHHMNRKGHSVNVFATNSNNNN